MVKSHTLSATVLALRYLSTASMKSVLCQCLWGHAHSQLTYTLLQKTCRQQQVFSPVSM